MIRFIELNPSSKDTEYAKWVALSQRLPFSKAGIPKRYLDASAAGTNLSCALADRRQWKNR